MGKWSKIVSFILVVVLGFFLVKNLFFSNKDKNANVDYSRIYEKHLKPINVHPKSLPLVSQENNNLASQYASLWKYPELYEKSSHECLEYYLEYHPANIVQRDKVFEYYGIKIGTNAWDQLTKSYEKQAVEICYSYSGIEIQNLFAKTIGSEFSESELQELLDFFNTRLGKKYLDFNHRANDKILDYMSEKQREVYNRETNDYNTKLKLLYEQYLEEDGGWFKRNYYKLFSK